MTRWILIGSALGVAALGAAWGIHHHATKPAERPSASRIVDSVSRDRPRVLRSEPSGPRDLDELLADGSRAAWGEIASLYPASDAMTKRRILEGISKVPRFEQVVEYVLATVGEDPVPAEHDPLIEEAEAVLKSRIKTPEDFDHARRAMVMQQTDKRRWVLANALTEFAEGTTGDSPYLALKGQLTAKLIDLHSETRDPYVKDAIVDAVRSLGDSDAALILAEGPNVKDEDLQGVSEQNAARDQALRGAGAP